MFALVLWSEVCLFLMVGRNIGVGVANYAYPCASVLIQTANILIWPMKSHISPLGECEVGVVCSDSGFYLAVGAWAALIAALGMFLPAYWHRDNYENIRLHSSIEIELPNSY